MYNADAPGTKKQAEVGGQEGYLRLTKNGKTVEVTTTNGHAKAHGKLKVDGQESDIKAVLLDGKVFAPFDFINVLCDGDYHQFKDFKFVADTSAKNSESFFTKIAA